MSIRVLSGAQIRILWVSALKKGHYTRLLKLKSVMDNVFILIIFNVSYAMYFFVKWHATPMKSHEILFRGQKQVVMFRAPLLAIKGSEPSLSVLELLCQSQGPESAVYQIRLI